MQNLDKTFYFIEEETQQDLLNNNIKHIIFLNSFENTPEHWLDLNEEIQGFCLPYDHVELTKENTSEALTGIGNIVGLMLECKNNPIALLGPKPLIALSLLCYYHHMDQNFLDITANLDQVNLYEEEWKEMYSYFITKYTSIIDVTKDIQKASEEQRRIFLF